MTIPSINNHRPYKSEPALHQVPFAGKMIAVRLSEAARSPTPETVQLGSSAFIEMVKGVVEGQLVNAFIKAESPSTKLMEKILAAPGALNQLLKNIEKHPEILTKKNEFGRTLLLQFVEENAFSNHFIGTHCDINIVRNRQTLKKLLLAGPWDKQDLLTGLTIVNRKTLSSDPWHHHLMTSELLPSWQMQDVDTAILKREDLTKEERNFIGALWSIPK